jgi:hypothetical protein
MPGVTRTQVDDFIQDLAHVIETPAGGRSGEPVELRAAA